MITKQDVLDAVAQKIEDDGNFIVEVTVGLKWDKARGR